MISLNEIEHFAAEYVLGTLDHMERVEVTTMRATSAAMDKAITTWEQRLAPLNDRADDAVPSENLFARIEQRIVSGQGVSPNALHEKPVKKWQQFAVAAVVIIVLGVSHYLLNNRSIDAPQLVATLQSDPSQPSFVVNFYKKGSMLDVHTAETASLVDKNYELWIIPAGAKAPLPVGILPKMDTKLPMIAGIGPAQSADATLAVSIEPLGGSPTGAPTGPVIVTGKFKQKPL